MEEEVPVIPFMGDGGIPLTTMPDALPWILAEDRVPLLLALSLYHSPREVLEDFKLVTALPRLAGWSNGILGVVGCRGTQIFGAHGGEDIKDDQVRFILTYVSFPCLIPGLLLPGRQLVFSILPSH